MKNNPVLLTTIIKYSVKYIIFILIGSEYFNEKSTQKYSRKTALFLVSTHRVVVIPYPQVIPKRR
jgi:hypothetical protein